MRILRKGLGLPWRIFRSIYFRAFKARKIQSVDKLVDLHFEFWSSPSHPSKPGLKIALNQFQGTSLRILETGTSAWGTDSTRLLDSYVKFFGGEFTSVDLRPDPKKRLRFQLGSKSNLFIGDSVTFIEQLDKERYFDFVYLDSFDVDWDHPEPSAIHGLREIQAILPHLAERSIVVIDDTPATFEFMNDDHQSARRSFQIKYRAQPGKGGLALNFLTESGFRFNVLHHSQNLVLEIRKAGASGRD